MQEPMQHTVKKNRMTRIAYRMVGVFFIAIGAAFILLMIKSHGSMGSRLFKFAFGLALAVYGCYLVKASFRKSAFDLTYRFEADELVIEKEKKKKAYHMPYEKITDVNLVIPDLNMPYYILKIDIGKEQFVLPFTGKREKCDAIYYHLLKKMGIYQEDD